MPHPVREIQTEQRRFRNGMLLAGWSLAGLVSLLAAFNAQSHLLISVMVLALIIGLVALLWMDKRTGRALELAEENSEALNKATDALRQREFAMNQHSIISMTDPDGLITYANDLFVAISGYSREELYGNTHRLINSGHHPQEFFTVMWNQITQGQVWHGEIKNINKAREVYWVAATLVPLLNSTGQPEAYISIRTDITRQKQLEESLSKQNQELQALTDHLSEHSHLLTEILEAIPLPVYLKGKDGHYQQLNLAFEEYFGVKREDYLGKTVFDLLEEETASLHHARDQQLFQEQGRQSYQARNRRSDGRFTDAVYKKAALLSAEGKTRGLVGVIFDVTERQQWEAGLVEARKAAEAASLAKSQFLANMSHEIRTPMNGVLGMLDLVLGTPLEREQKEYLDLARLSAEHLLEIINHLLDLSKIEAGRLDLQPIVFDLHELLGQTLRSLSSRAKVKGLQLLYDLGANVPTYVYADPSRLRQMLINLLGNAIKFTQSGEVQLQVRCLNCQSAEAQVELTVIDTGIGMSAEALIKVFEPFEQVQSERNRQFEGTGLGLSIVKQLAEMMGGTINATSEPEVGSTFTLKLPLPLAEQPERQSLDTDLGRFRVLLVDDHEVNRRVMAALLAQLGVESGLAASGQEALFQLRYALKEEQSYDLVLLDAQMPGLDGFKVAERIQQDEQLKSTRIVILTSSPEAGDAQKCRDKGLAGYLTKPVLRTELHATLNQVLGPLGAGQVGRSATTTATFCKGLNLLLAEDNLVNQKLATKLLEKQQHQVTVVADGKEALRALQQEDYDLVLMDMMMPVMDGLEATRLWRQWEKQHQLPLTPIVAMTANAMQGDKERCLAEGMQGYIPKPVNPQILYSEIDRVVDQYLPEKLERSGEPRGEFDDLLEQADSLIAELMQEEAAPQTAAEFDWDRALEALGADESLLLMALQMFVDEYPEHQAKLNKAWQAGNKTELGRVAHTLKSLLATFAAYPAQGEAAQLEHLAKQDVDFQELEVVLDKLQKHLDVLLPLLKGQLSAQGDRL